MIPSSISGFAPMLVNLSTDRDVALRNAGGKAASLIRLHRGGFPVPPGVVLTTEFFTPWFFDICSSAEWQRVEEIAAAGAAEQPRHQALAAACDALKAFSRNLPFNDQQRAALQEAAAVPAPFAVRSSSPEEDLTGASFAGLYETVLGVDASGLEEAVRTCFESCLDARVITYKREMGFADLSPSIAVIVQSLVASEVAGVAFSINPLTNDFDEALINASWGLGDALVTGDITPDSFVVDKLGNAVVERRRGDKGGERADEMTLSDEQAVELARTVAAIERLYATPMDVEWSFADGELCILQARPITSYVPLHPKLVTEPGEPRHLYFDCYLTDGVTMSVATTPMADDVFKAIMDLMFAWLFGLDPEERQDLDLDAGGVHLGCGRFYLDLSMWLHLMGNEKLIAKRAAEMNPMVASILTSPELDRYRLKPVPAVARLTNVLRHLPAMLWRSRRAVAVLLRPMFRSERFFADYQRVLAEFDRWVRQPVDLSQTVEACVVESMTECGTAVMNSSYPAFVYVYLMIDRIKGLADAKSLEQQALADAVCGGYEKDMIVHMGLLLYDMARMLPRAAYADLDALEQDLGERRLPDEFYTLWEGFVHDYGCRGPLEMEIAKPKYGDSPGLVLKQLKNLAAAGGTFDPHEMHRRRVGEREEAYAELLRILPRRKARKLEKAYAVCLRYSDAREYFKHHLMQCYARIRELLMHRANELVQADRLDEAGQIFDLTIAEVDEARRNPEFDARAAAETRGALARTLRRQVRHFPLCIDSRGRILRPEPQIESGALRGSPVSPGVARGPIKVLSDPFEKELQPGDVLVAVTTDPGWTPLFINVSAVILEVGGELQHGALVAREYGKPCVAGIPDVTNQFTDGQLVEVDGSTGAVRFLPV